MITKAFKYLILGSFCFIGLGMVAPLSSHSTNQTQTHKKLYVDPSQVSIDCCGLFVFSGDVLKPIKAVYHDDHGFYIKNTPQISGTCQNGHASVSYLNECADPICSYYYAESDW